MQDIFYKVKKKDWIPLLKDAKLFSYNVRVDIQKTWQRTASTYTFADCLEMLDESCHFVFIHRRFPDNEQHIETGFCTMAREHDVFLFVDFDIKYKQQFIDKYNLQLL